MSGHRLAQLAWLVSPDGRPIGIKETDGDETFIPTFNANFTGLLKPDGTTLVLGGTSPTGEAAPGASAYQVAVNNGYQGTEQQWLASLVGPTGRDGTNGTNGKDGTNGTNGQDGQPGAKGADGAKGDTGAAGPGVPTGGAAGQVLTKNSGADFDTSWQTPAAGGSGGAGATQIGNVDAVSAGVMRFLISAHKYSSFGTLAAVAGRLYYVPFLLRQDTTVTALTINVTTAGAAGATARTAIYSRNAQGYIGDLIAATPALDVSTSGFKQASLPSPVVLKAGWYFTAVFVSLSTTISAYNTATTSVLGGSPMGFNGLIQIEYRYESNGSNTEFPASASPTTTAVNINTAAAPPLVLMVPA